MNAVAQELFRTGDRYLMERPADMATLRTRMGTRGQNLTVAIYAYVSLNSSVDLLYQLQENCPKEEYDLDTLVRITVDWLASLAPHHVSHCYGLHELADLTSRAMDELKKAGSREEVREIIQGLEHYYNMIRTWIDLEFPWHEVAVRYAEVMGDPPPRPAP